MGTRQAASEAESAQAPAAAEPEVGILAPGSEGLFAQKGLRGIRGEKALKDRAGIVLTLKAVDLSVQHFIGDSGGKLDAGQLVRQVRL